MAFGINNNNSSQNIIQSHFSCMVIGNINVQCRNRAHTSNDTIKYRCVFGFVFSLLLINTTTPDNNCMFRFIRLKTLPINKKRKPNGNKEISK